jgi:hypothetical protein
MLVIAMALGLVGAGASGAFFSDVETTSSTANSGIIDITLSGDVGATSPIVINDLKPCDTGWINIVVHNTAGGNEGPVYLHFDVEEGLGHDVVCTEPEDIVQGCGVNDIANWIWVDLYIDDVCIVEDGVITLADLDCFWFPAGWLGAGETASMKIDISLHLNADAGNEYQADGVSFTLEVEQRDHNAPPPENMILLENKDPENEWKIIEDDGVWGIAAYQVNSLDLFVWATGLEGGADYQICLTSPEAVDWYPLTQVERESMASALASGVYGTPPSNVDFGGEYNLFERGYSTSGGSSLHGTYVTGDQGVFTTSKNGATSRTITADANGVIAELVSFPLPSGAYQYIKVTVKEDFDPYTTILMEATTPLTFTIPEP